MNDEKEHWVFGYGSLMWNPGFAFVEHSPAVLTGYQRCLCIYSFGYRGTPEKPGVVLGLDAHVGETCMGMAFRVDPANWDTVSAYLDKREISDKVYTRERLPVRLSANGQTGREVSALTYVAVQDGPQYTGELAEGEVLKLLRQGVGPRGTSIEYLANTVAHLDELGINDGPLHQILDKVMTPPK